MLKKILDHNIGRDDIRAFIDAHRNGDEDIYLDNSEWRIIRADAIDDILKDELASDTYVLGCANAWFLADVLGISQDTIEKMQSAEGFEALGELVIGTGKLDDYAQGIISHDGYGHHFATYDGNEHEFTVQGVGYYAFKV